MKEKHLSVAPEKTETILLIGRKKHEKISFQMLDNTIEPVGQLKYLEVILDNALNFSVHAQMVIEKGDLLSNELARLMPKIGEPVQKKRKLLVETVHAMMVYAKNAKNGV